MAKDLLILCSDVSKTSAQGVRYKELFWYDHDYSQRMIVTFSETVDYIRYVDSFTCLDGVKPPIIQIAIRTLYKLAKRLLAFLPFVDASDLVLPLYTKKLDKLLQKGNLFDLIICVTPFSLMRLAKKVKANSLCHRLVLDMSDPYSFNMSINSPLLHRIRFFYERKYFAYFDQLVVVSNEMADEYSRLHPMYKDKFKVVEQGVDEGFIDRIRLQTRNDKTKSDAISFLYAGGFYQRGRNPVNLYKAFTKSDECAFLLIFGNIRKALKPHSLTRIACNAAVSRNELAQITAEADVLVLFDNDYGYQVPGKTLEILASGKPVLFIYHNEDSPTLRYVREANGVVWAKSNAMDIQAGIRMIINGEHEKPFFDYQPYTWDKMRKKYQSIMNG